MAGVRSILRWSYRDYWNRGKISCKIW